VRGEAARVNNKHGQARLGRKVRVEPMEGALIRGCPSF